MFVLRRVVLGLARFVVFSFGCVVLFDLLCSGVLRLVVAFEFFVLLCVLCVCVFVGWVVCFVLLWYVLFVLFCCVCVCGLCLLLCFVLFCVGVLHFVSVVSF